MQLRPVLLCTALTCSLAAGTVRAEQITSTCRITAVDAAQRKVTLLRKTAAGEREGTAKVAEDAVIKVNGEPTSLDKLAVPVEGIVVYDTERKAITTITALKSGPSKPGSEPPRAVSPFDAKKAKEHQAAWAKHLGVPVEITNSIGMKLVLIPPGEFEMGSTKAEVGALAEETKSQWYKDSLPAEAPKHQVRITRPFYMGECEVTQEEFERVMGNNPSEFKDDPRRPVEQVTWDDATDFCRKLSDAPQERANRVGYRLPTEAEWEHACRAGTTTRFSFGNTAAKFEEHAWGSDNSERKTHAVGQLQPNAFGLRDMHGNVWEWCGDWLDGRYYSYTERDNPSGPPADSSRSARAMRGGSHSNVPAMCRSAYRIGNEPLNRVNTLGFRVIADPLAH